jgi:hypothetical protein
VDQGQHLVRSWWAFFDKKESKKRIELHNLYSLGCGGAGEKKLNKNNFQKKN